MSQKIIHTIESIKARCEEVGPCWEWQQGFTSANIPQVRHDGKPMSVRRVIYSLKNGPIPRNSVISCTCGNHRCVNPEHMVRRSHDQHMKLIGKNIIQTLVKRKRLSDLRRQKAGKLSVEIVQEMRSGSKSSHQWARELGVSQKTAWNAINGKTWKVYDSHWFGLGI